MPLSELVSPPHDWAIDVVMYVYGYEPLRDIEMRVKEM